MKEEDKLELRKLLRETDINLDDYESSVKSIMQATDKLYKCFIEDSKSDSSSLKCREVKDRLFRVSNYIKEIRFYNDHILNKDKGLEYSLVIPEHILELDKDSYEFQQIISSIGSDFLLKKCNPIDKYFIHFTDSRNNENIQNEGITINGLNRSLSFGTGIYFYEINIDNFNFFRSLGKRNAIIFKIDKDTDYFKCMYDLADGTHDGSSKYPPVCYCAEDIPAKSIVGIASSLEEIVKYLKEVQKF